MELNFLSKITIPLIREKQKEKINELTDADRRLIEICNLNSLEEVYKTLSSSPQGLSEELVKKRFSEYGYNEIKKSKQEGILLQLVEKTKNPLILQMLFIAIISLVMGDKRAAIVVMVMIFISIILSYFQETKSSKAVERLQRMVQTKTFVIREGKEKEIPAKDVVVGDIVVLNAGAIIPADIRLISTKDFFINQSALTGESMPVEKTSFNLNVKISNVIELTNACFQGSYVVSGSALGIVVNTGENTYIGSISKKISTRIIETSFDRGISEFTWLMIRFMIIMVSIIFFIIGITKGKWIDALLFSLSVAVGLTPEMLPMILTVNLARGAITMSSKKVIVKKLSSIQNFGAIDVLCTDKTGTLTQDRVILEKYVDITGKTSEDVLRYAYMNSYYQTGLRNLLDRAVLSHAELEVEKTCPKVDEIPFDFNRKRMSVIIEYEGNNVMITKGSVEDIYKVCSHYQLEDEIYPLINVIRKDLMEDYEKLSSQGYRVVAIAYREFPKEKRSFHIEDETDMILLGYLAFLDPPKESAFEAINRLKKIGISIKVLTGDNELVTKKVCLDVGLDVSEIITGENLLSLNENEFSKVVEKYSVFARLSPSQKEKIISKLRENGHTVGFLGDGINDALALNFSDVGISVDTAVDVAKESADIILLEKNLNVLYDGVMEGRRVFGNIIKYIKMGASSNFGNMFSVLGASYIVPFLPMLPIQILLNNLLYDISQIAIPTDRVDKEYLERPRKWNIHNIKKFMLIMGPVSSIFDYATFFLMLFYFNVASYSNSTISFENKIYLERLFQTGWFVESLLTQTLIIHIIRTKRIPFFESIASMPLIFSTISVAAIGVFLPYSVFADKLNFVRLPFSFWLWILLFIFSYAFLAHYAKAFFYRKFGED